MHANARPTFARLQGGVLATAMLAAACGGPTVSDVGSTTASSVPLATSSAAAAASSTRAAATPTAEASLDIVWAPFASKRFAYMIEVPEDWTTTEATTDWPNTGWPAPDGTAVDRFAAAGGSRRQVSIAADRLDADETAIGRRAEIDQETALSCTISNAGTVAIDGATGQREDEFCFGKDHLIDVWVEHAGRVYLIDWLSSEEISSSDRVLFDAMLGRMAFTD